MLAVWLMMLAAGVRLADVAAVPAWLMRQATTFLFLFGVGSDWLFGGAGVGDFPGFSQKNDFGSCLFL